MFQFGGIGILLVVLAQTFENSPTSKQRYTEKYLNTPLCDHGIKYCHGRSFLNEIEIAWPLVLEEKTYFPLLKGKSRS